MKLLHIIASPRIEKSNTLRVSAAFLDELDATVPDLEVETLDLFAESLPGLAGANIDAKYSLMAGAPVDPTHADSWERIEHTIERFLAADAYLISTPLWNLGTPYALKYYIDCIVQPGYLFRYNEQGYPVPLVHDRKMVVVTSSGSDYSPGSPLQALNFQEPYLRAIFGFVGITDITFVHGHAMDASPTHRADGIASAIDEARVVASSEAWRDGDVEVA
ncbi:FMN-dependent NADH-azoreductase 1 [Agromyces rhizosphaerae]|uniref:FMN dependent NADH:quinone oxidoreductase n=1 Tax=Agromyces rhizosphaerae TaxID=88374 RepID=A0A9W6FN22_9MICO|nr:NAD(P)H-dependent oxidoreductase [Agromyces rhizosphaerae]GLI26504.1 FMN-dependent NADH-azoreductase 1 [Agromyces rhizosphaerae]